MFCPNCGKDVGNSKFCSECGNKISVNNGISPSYSNSNTFNQRANENNVKTKYCSHCGAEIADEAVICINCGCSTERQKETQVSNSDDTLDIIIKIFLVLGCISIGWLIVPLIWCIPITVSIFDKMKNGEEISTGLKVCALIFVNLIAGIILFCRDD